MGAVRSSVSETCLPVVSARLNSGACWPTCGAPLDGGSQRAATKTAKTKNPTTATLTAATIEVITFERVGCGRSDANPRRTPITTSTAATRKISRLAHGKSRVKGNQTKTAKYVMNATRVSRKPTHSGQLKRLIVIKSPKIWFPPGISDERAKQSHYRRCDGHLDAVTHDCSYDGADHDYR